MNSFAIIKTPLADESCLTLCEDDYYEVWNYFSDIVKRRVWRALPAGIETPASPPKYFHPDIIISSSNELHTYNTDVRGRLDDVKENALPLFCNMLGKQINKESITLYPSSTQAILSILISKKQKGVRNIIFEAPCYFGGIYQAVFLEMKIHILLTSQDEQYEAGVDSIARLNSVDAPYVLMLTEPKFGIGTRRSIPRLKELLERLPANSTVIIDEAPDLSWGPRKEYWDALSVYKGDLYRIRGLTKGLALNGVKISILHHSEEVKSALSSTHDTISGSLDAYSLQYLRKIAVAMEEYSDMARSAVNAVKKNHMLLQSLITNRSIKLSKIEAGYFGLIKIDLGEDGDFQPKRWAFLRFAKEGRLPLVTGESLYVPCDLRHEWVRINYFLPESEIIETAMALNEIVTRYQEEFYTKLS